jgi:hypothetical protein
MKYYNQRNYPHILFPSKGFPEESICISGCGPTCCSMLVENLTKHAFDPIESAAYAIEVGARDDAGTDMKILGPRVAERFGFHYHTGNDIEEVLDFLQKEKGFVIANSGGNEEDYTGVFTEGGHYILLTAAKGRVIEVLDPSLYPDKFSRPGRKEKVFWIGERIYCDAQFVMDDCRNRDPAFYFFEPKEA